MIKILGIEMGILIFHLVILQFGFIPANFFYSLNVDLFLAFLFISGLLISYPGIKKGAENFTLRFLVMTTMQLLSMMGLILVLAFMKIPNVKIVGYSSISVFILLLIVQSAYLVKEMNKK